MAGIDPLSIIQPRRHAYTTPSATWRRLLLITPLRWAKKNCSTLRTQWYRFASLAPISIVLTGSRITKVCVVTILQYNWEVGTIQPGSSGSPLFSGNSNRVIGVLSGVDSCTYFNACGYQENECKVVFALFPKLSAAWDGPTGLRYDHIIMKKVDLSTIIWSWYIVSKIRVYTEFLQFDFVSLQPWLDVHGGIIVVLWRTGLWRARHPSLRGTTVRIWLPSNFDTPAWRYRLLRECGHKRSYHNSSKPDSRSRPE